MINYKYNLINTNKPKLIDWIDIKNKQLYTKSIFNPKYKYYTFAANYNVDNDKYDIFIILLENNSILNAKKINIDNYGRIKININNIINYLKYNNPDIKDTQNIEFKIYENKRNFISYLINII